MDLKPTLYPNSPNSAAVNQGTLYPGMPTSQVEKVKPIMGFLFSVSKTAAGEYWPVYVGPNYIGRSPECGVNLQEASVSENHATLVVRKMQNNGESNGLFVFIQDTGSMCGTMLNGVTLDFNPRECKSGDIISIGESYELYFMLIDTDSIGLHPKKDFKKTEAGQQQAQMPPVWNQPPVGMFSQGPKGTMPGNGVSPFDNSNSKKTMYMPPQK